MDERKELGQVYRDFYPHIATLRRSSEPVPSDWNGVIDAAVYAKREGHYAASARIIVDTMVDEGVMYTGALSSLYKTLACGDLPVPAFVVLLTAKQIYDQNPAPAMPGVPSTFDDHIDRFKVAMTSEAGLNQYLREISGNPNYQLARPYEAISAEWGTFTKNVISGFGPSKKSGCYIATAVYGSYDAPQVRVLRRFRDERLAATAPGRAFIRAYYAISPPLARHLDSNAPASRTARAVLDRVVRRLT
ncbi:CFI-box-CTERM domain-containing protein [Cellulosimicrobium composti]|uniref:Uncharacterized protein n=1 Tax=Cellulosimicrobium composti TaxID=2672572 RepID=A0ABX0BFR3_9MICO|nr:CFI-box-CTERM domain-containing protein [Cellulosimicrobium composti]NDO91469.1 hypothetical protein [Cellulosimicrobium composti]